MLTHNIFRHGGARLGRTLAVGAGALAIGSLTATTAHADTVVRPPDVSVPGESGLRISIQRQSATVSPSLAANGSGRNAWLSAHIVVNAPHIPTAAPGPVNGPTGEQTLPGSNGASYAGGAGMITAGYIIGCQVGLAGIGIGGSTTISASAASLSGSLSVPLTPGQVAYVLIDYKPLTKPATYSIDYQDFPVGIEQCGGFAQARSYAVVETGGNDHQKLEAYGQPFSVG